MGTSWSIKNMYWHIHRMKRCTLVLSSKLFHLPGIFTENQIQTKFNPYSASMNPYVPVNSKIITGHQMNYWDHVLSVRNFHWMETCTPAPSVWLTIAPSYQVYLYLTWYKENITAIALDGDCDSWVTDHTGITDTENAGWGKMLL